uniref:Uncharacterized protein n=1 Tax=Rhizophora mucronata TaxID=61149 RepID=A0A2P2MSR3_RHIMU
MVGIKIHPKHRNRGMEYRSFTSNKNPGSCSSTTLARHVPSNAAVRNWQSNQGGMISKNFYFRRQKRLLVSNFSLEGRFQCTRFPDSHREI